jgi:hypothetical protein
MLKYMNYFFFFFLLSFFNMFVWSYLLIYDSDYVIWHVYFLYALCLVYMFKIKSCYEASIVCDSKIEYIFVMWRYNKLVRKYSKQQ